MFDGIDSPLSQTLGLGDRSVLASPEDRPEYAAAGASRPCRPVPAPSPPPAAKAPSGQSWPPACNMPPQPAVIWLCLWPNPAALRNAMLSGQVFA